jgi:hypothetical protein
MRYGDCDDCGKVDYLGYLACHNRHLCPDCASKILHADPTELRASLMESARQAQALLDEINIDYACRALLGGGKGQSVMNLLQEQDPDYYKRIMAEARKRLSERGIKNVKLSAV